MNYQSKKLKGGDAYELYPMNVGMECNSNILVQIIVNWKEAIKTMRITKTKTIAIATAIATLLSASAVFAATSSRNTIKASRSTKTHLGGVNNGFKSHLDSLLTAGTITQAQEDAIQAAITATRGDVNKRPNDGLKSNLAALVTAGKITQAQADAITTAISTAAKSEGGVKTALDALVTAGTITQAQENAITPKKGDFKRGPENGFKTVLDSLVKAGTITQVQEDAIQGS